MWCQRFARGGCLLAGLLGASVWAQGVSSGAPVRILVGAPAGGSTDTMARAVAQAMGQQLGRTVVVENRLGAGGNLAAEAVARAAPDGQTLLMSFTSHAINASLYPRLPFDPVKDFTPLTMVSTSPSVLVAHPSLAVNNVAELVALAKAKPGEISSASSGNGSTGHIATEVFSSRAGVKLMNVFYKGNSQAVIDVISGQTNLIFDQVSTAASHVRAGKVRALAVTSTNRSPLFPDIPTMAEAGYPGYEDVTLNMLLAPAGTPKEIVAKIHADVAKAFAQPELVARFVERSIELVASPSPEEFGQLIRSEVARLGKVAREAGIKAE